MSLRARVSVCFLVLTCSISVSLVLLYNSYATSVSQIQTIALIRADQETHASPPLVPVRNAANKARGKGRTLCRLPELDPYHVDVKKYIKKLEKPVCQGDNFGYFHNGLFHVVASDVRDLTVRIIRRKPEDDFEVDTSRTIGILMHPKTTLAQGRYGCLGMALHVNHIVLPKNLIEGSSYAILKPQECTYEGILSFGEDGKITHLASKRCLYMRDKKLLFGKCSSMWSKFDFDDDGHVWVDDSGLWGLWSKTYCAVARHVGEHWKLRLVKNCEKGPNPSTFYILEAKAQDVNIKVKIDEEAFELFVVKGDEITSEYHVHAPNLAKIKNVPLKPSALPLNIMLLMFDSQSSANFERAMPLTMKKLGSLKESFNMKGHTIVGDGTTAQLCAMLTGVAEENLPEARRNKDGSDYVDRWPFIFQPLSKSGYVTLMTDDQPSTASFNMRLHGFKNQPTDHYGRPFWIVAEKAHSTTYCIKNKFSHQYNFDYIKSFTTNYPKNWKFSLTITSDLCHNSVNPVQFADQDLHDLLTFLDDGGHLNDTFLVIFGDHGNRVSEFRETLQGKLEERLPFCSITVPRWLRRSHPHYIQALEHNSAVLTSHFDIYHTMMDLIGLYDHSNPANVGQSLLHPIDNSTRTCTSAGIDDHWCPCLVFTSVNPSDSSIRPLAVAVVNYMNKMIRSVARAKELCHTLELGRVLKAGVREPSSKVQRFSNTKRSDKCDSCDVEYKDEPSFTSSRSYELIIEVLPSHGRFEANVMVDNGVIKVDPLISRTNRYGNQPKCIEHKVPSLRKYCMCKT